MGNRGLKQLVEATNQKLREGQMDGEENFISIIEVNRDPNNGHNPSWQLGAKVVSASSEQGAIKLEDKYNAKFVGKYKSDGLDIVEFEVYPSYNGTPQLRSMQ